MIFSEQQIHEIIETIKFQHLFFIAGNVSTEILSVEDKLVLLRHGVDISKLSTDLTSYEELFYFGRLASILGQVNTSKVTYRDFKKYLSRGQFIPLSRTEKDTLLYLQKKSYSYIKGLGETMTSFITGKVEDENLATRKFYEDTINDSLKRAVIERDSVRSVVLEIGKKTGDWERDLGRIAQTELQNAYEYGKGTSMYEIYGDKKIYYKEVYPGACKHCIRLYLTNGIGSEPRLFTYSSLLMNGTNIGKKVDDWKPVLGTVHPFCRCDLRRKYSDDDQWDSETGMYQPKDREVKSKGSIKIQVGDTTFKV